jgi:hypothetical protein
MLADSATLALATDPGSTKQKFRVYKEKQEW